MSVLFQVLDYYVRVDSSADIPASGLIPGTIYVDTAGGVFVASSSTTYTTVGSGGGTTKYSPDRPPTSGTDAGSTDEFTGGFGLTWRWQNQSSSTDTAAMDTSFIEVPSSGGRSMRTRWVTAPAAGDMSFATKITASLNVGFNACGIAILSGGSEAVPTEIWQCGLLSNASHYQVLIQRYTDYATQSGTADSFTVQTSDPTVPQTFYILVSYVNSSKVITVWVSLNGMDWRSYISTGTLANAPISVGRFVESFGVAGCAARFHYQRTFTSGAALANPFQIGR